MGTYIVRQWDTLGRIAQQYGLSSPMSLYSMQSAEFKKTHPNPDIIHPGDVLRVPDPPAAAAQSQPALSPQQQGAMALVNAFALRQQSQAFTAISRVLVAQGLRSRVTAPSSINQRSSSLCGPSSVLYHLARYQPERYVQFVIDLYEHGCADLGTLRIVPSSDLKAYDPGLEVHPADWIPAASIRDSENALFDYQSVSDEFAGITLPGELVEWLRALGFTEIVDRTTTFAPFSTPAFQNLLEAGVSREQGWWVFLFINSKMLDTSTQDEGSSVPNHWVVLRSSTIGGQSVRLDIYTWGERRAVPTSGTLSTRSCLRNYYGFVKCKY